MTDPSLAAVLQDRYVLERELGHGGMATVYLALDLKHKRRVALKVLRPALAATLGPDRFRREIETAARLQHPHICSAFDSGEDAGRLCFRPGAPSTTRTARASPPSPRRRFRSLSLPVGSAHRLSPGTLRKQPVRRTARSEAWPRSARGRSGTRATRRSRPPSAPWGSVVPPGKTGPSGRPRCHGRGSS